MARKIKLTMVDKGELGHIHPQTVIYNVGNKTFLLAEDESGNYLIKPVYKNGTLGETILSKTLAVIMILFRQRMMMLLLPLIFVRLT